MAPKFAWIEKAFPFTSSGKMDTTKCEPAVLRDLVNTIVKNGYFI